jgi:hypothetical protein
MGKNMKRQFKALVLGAVLAGLSSATMAQDAKQPPRAKADSAGSFVITPNAAADAPNARLAGLIRHDTVVLRNKNIEDVNRAAMGVYCILPKPAAMIDPKTAIVQLTPEYYYSGVNEIMVQWATKGSGCPADRIAVYTLSDINADGIYTFSNVVSFSIYVP